MMFELEEDVEDEYIYFQVSVRVCSLRMYVCIIRMCNVIYELEDDVEYMHFQVCVHVCVWACMYVMYVCTMWMCMLN